MNLLKNALALISVFLIPLFFAPQTLSADDKPVNAYLQGERPSFDRILLIVNYNHPHYKSIPFIKELYGHIFPNMVFYGEKEDPNVIAIDQHLGWWGQNVLADAMIRWPDYEGYICVQDDCFMNFWNYGRLDKNKIWFSPMGSGIPLETLSHPWSWWNMECGRAALLAALDKLDQKYYDRLIKNNLPGRIFVTWSDFVYVPQRLREDYIQVCSCFSNPHVFVEIAIPQILLCIDNIQNIEILNTYWAWPPDHAILHYNVEYDWVHPMKFSNPGIREKMKSIVDLWKFFVEQNHR
jgi:hypothetical protein